jgi:hypothetical protein
MTDEEALRHRLEAAAARARDCFWCTYVGSHHREQPLAHESEPLALAIVVAMLRVAAHVSADLGVDRMRFAQLATEQHDAAVKEMTKWG